LLGFLHFAGISADTLSAPQLPARDFQDSVFIGPIGPVDPTEPIQKIRKTWKTRKIQKSAAYEPITPYIRRSPSPKQHHPIDRQERSEPMKIIISNSSEKPIYEQIVTQIKNAILSGELAAGDPLPSLRFLAKELRVSIISTKRAYEELEKEGYIESIQGKGSFVTGRNRELMREEQFRKIEACLSSAVEMAQISEISLRELIEVLETLYEDTESKTDV